MPSITFNLWTRCFLNLKKERICEKLWRPVSVVFDVNGVKFVKKNVNTTVILDSLIYCLEIKEFIAGVGD
jgi:hypothetical protein